MQCDREANYAGEEKPAGTQTLKAGNCLKQRGVTHRVAWWGAGGVAGRGAVWELLADKTHPASLQDPLLLSPNHPVAMVSPPLLVVRSLN